jgi:hypothetical protein
MTGMEKLPSHQSSGRSPSEEEAGDVAEFGSYLDQDVSRFFYRWGGLLSSTLIRIRARFQGDLDQYLIYLVFLLDDLSLTISAQARGGRRKESDARGLNALSIAEVTSIPRETARRKLQMLVASGYIDRAADGLYYLGDRYGMDQFFFDLSPLFWEGVRPDRMERQDAPLPPDRPADRPDSAEPIEPQPELTDR